MKVYIVMLALVTVFGFCAVWVPFTESNGVRNNLKLVRTKKPNTLFVWLVFFCLAFVAMFRYSVGMDFFAYFKKDNWANRFKEGDYSDPGFTVLAIICDTLFGVQSGALTIISAFITVAIFVFTIARSKENFAVSVLLFIFIGCFTGMFNGIRQYLATAIMFAGHRFIIDKKPIKWLLVVLLASTFHVTAILMFFVYFVANLNCNWKLVIMYLFIAIILLFAYEPLFNLVGALKQDEINTSDSYMTTAVNLLRVLVQCVPVMFLFFIKNSDINEDKETRFLLNICLLNAAIAVASMNSAYLARFWIYTSCFQILMYPKIFSKMKSRESLIFIIMLMFLYSIFWAYDIINATYVKDFHWVFKYIG